MFNTIRPFPLYSRPSLKSKIISPSISIRKSLPSTVRNSVWNVYVGPNKKIDNCFCCQYEIISFANFECGHIKSRSKNGSDVIQNLRPICSLCNKSMGTLNMELFMTKYGFTKNKNWYGSCEKSDVLKR